MRFTSVLVHFRKATPALRLRAHPTERQIQWHGHRAHEPDWEPGSRFVAYTLTDGAGSAPLYVAFNSSYQPAAISLPDPGQGRRWKARWCLLTASDHLAGRRTVSCGRPRSERATRRSSSGSSLTPCLSLSAPLSVRPSVRPLQLLMDTALPTPYDIIATDISPDMRQARAGVTSLARFTPPKVPWRRGVLS